MPSVFCITEVLDPELPMVIHDMAHVWSLQGNLYAWNSSLAFVGHLPVMQEGSTELLLLQQGSCSPSSSWGAVCAVPLVGQDLLTGKILLKLLHSFKGLKCSYQPPQKTKKMELCKYQTKIQCYFSAVISIDKSFGLGNGVGSKQEGWQNWAHETN